MTSSAAQLDPVYDEVAAFLGALVAGGMRHIVLSPGSRSTPLTVCAAAHPDLTHWMQLDERTAAFFALGIAKATRQPVALACTSGTAAANYFPAVIEASRTGVPLLIVSADRPPELHGGWGTNQTIDQENLFGRYPRSFRTMPIGGSSSPDAAAAVAFETLDSMRSPVGPAHVNWPFRKPLEPLGAVPVVRRDPASLVAAQSGDIQSIHRLREFAGRRGAIVAGPLDDPEWTSALALFAESVGWPILAEATSQLRLLEPSPNTIAASERFLLAPVLAEALKPDVVLFAGATPTGTSALQWAESHGASLGLLIDPAAPWNDAGSVDAEPLTLVASELAELAVSVETPSDGEWLDHWRRLDAAAISCIDAVVGESLSGPMAVRSVVAGLPEGSHAVIANSMSVRDLDRYVPVREGVRVHVSRGASGIDGQVATALGVAASTGEPVTLVIGDVAFLHDIGSLYAAARLGYPLRIVVLNDNGGGIFSMLPIAERGDEVGFHELFHTPHDTDFGSLRAIGGVSYERIDSVADLGRLGSPGIGTGESPVGTIEVAIDHDVNLGVRAEVDRQLRAITL